MEIILVLGFAIIIALLLVLYIEIEKILDNSYEIGKFLDRQEKRELRCARQLQKYAETKQKGKK